MSEESISERTKLIGQILRNKFEEIENLALNKKYSGVPVCFYDYDNMTQGIPRGGLTGNPYIFIRKSK